MPNLDFFKILFLTIPIAAGMALLGRQWVRWQIHRRYGMNPGKYGEEVVMGFFAKMQILTACYVAFAHGANDVANAVGPIAAIFSVVKTKSVALQVEVPFENLQKHADKLKECAHLFKEALDCHIGGEWKEFELLTEKVARMESEADAIKRNIRNHLPRGILMPVDKFQLFDYLREQDLVDAVIPSIEKLSDLVALASAFFKTKSKTKRLETKSLIRDIRQYEHEADWLERELKFKIFSIIKDPLSVFHLILLIEVIGGIADHAQNAADRMRAMIAR